MVHHAYPTAAKPDKARFLPVTDENFHDIKKPPLSPIQLKPKLLLQDYGDSGLDNPAYFDAVKIRKEERAKKQKFSSLGVIPEESSAAKLTKVPGLNIWRLDFRKPDLRRKRRTFFCQKLILTLAIVGVAALTVSGIAILVHAVKGGLIFGVPWFPFGNGDSSSPGVNRVKAHFRIMNRYFTPELSNTSSEAHRQLVAELKHSLDIVFTDSPLANEYNTSEDFSFTNGSVVVQCVIQLMHPMVDGAQTVGFAFLRALEKGKGILPPGRFYVDVHTVTFSAFTKPVDENILQDLEGLEPWSSWSSCIADGVCNATHVRIRYRKCRESRTRLCGEDTEIVETKPCTCPPTTFTIAWSEWSLWSPCPENMDCNQGIIQKRTRNCIGEGFKIRSPTLCSKKTHEVGTQIRHCTCQYSR